MCVSPFLLALSLSLSLPISSQPVVTWSGETMRLASAQVTVRGAGWSLRLVMDDDNGNGALPSSYRRWWHCEISNLDPAVPDTLYVEVANAGYTDIILPVWSRKAQGGAFGPYERLPASATPSYSAGTHSFTVVVPAGIEAIRLAKYFPYTVADKDRFVASIATHPRVSSVGARGLTAQGRPITRLVLTDGNAPAAGKKTVWIHAGIHPAETTSYWVVEGLVDFLLSGDLRAEELLRNLVFEIHPMVNPDGVALGNYRTNSTSTNLETEWASPYSSSVPEIVALRSGIEALMGTPQQPGAHPIAVLLNLHSTHGSGYPYHYRHVSNPAFDLATNPSGVVPAVHQLETRWIDAVDGRSPLVALGGIGTSSCGAPVRPYVECMMHDRWSIDPQWIGGANPQSQVMAITFEGTYGKGPDAVHWNVPDDYRQVGREMALALGDFLDLLPRLRLDVIGTPCPAALPLTASIAPSGPSTLLTFALTGMPPAAGAWLAIGPANLNVPFTCPLLVNPQFLLPMSPGLPGAATLPLLLSPAHSFSLEIQGISLDPVAGLLGVHLSDAHAIEVAL